MTKKVVQINFKFNVPAEEYEKAVAELVSQFAALGGLQWKIWIINADNKEAGGIYLFEDDASVQAYLKGELAAGLKAHPALTDLSVKQFDVMEELTAATRGPV